MNGLATESRIVGHAVRSTEKAPCENQPQAKKAVFADFTVTVIDRKGYPKEDDLKLVNLVNTAYGLARIDSQNKSAPTSKYFCLKKNDTLLACAGFEYGDLSNSRVSKLDSTDCYISPFAASRGKGYGGVLLRAVEQEAKDRNFKRLVFDVWNEAPMDMNGYYKRYGCVQGETVENQNNTTTQYSKQLV